MGCLWGMCIIVQIRHVLHVVFNVSISVFSHHVLILHLYSLCAALFLDLFMCYFKNLFCPLLYVLCLSFKYMHTFQLTMIRHLYFIMYCFEHF